MASGRVIVRFTIEPDGHVAGASIVASAIGDAPAERCIVDRLGGFSFPPSARGIAVTYPFVFSSLEPDR
jgi:TonB family protein